MSEPSHDRFYCDFFERWMEPGDCDSGPLAGQEIKCSVCGEEQTLQFMHWCNQELHDRKLCHTCNHWREIHDGLKAEPFRYLIIDGKSYEPAPEDAGPMRGFGGFRFRIKRSDGVEVHSTNLWHQGDVSAHWREKMPDNAVFVATGGESGSLADIDP